MRFETKSVKIAERGLTDLFLGKKICKSQRLNLIRCLADAAKKEGDLKRWHMLLDCIKNYEYITDFDTLDKILIKLGTKFDFMEDNNETY